MCPAGKPNFFADVEVPVGLNPVWVAVLVRHGLDEGGVLLPVRQQVLTGQNNLGLEGQKNEREDVPAGMLPVVPVRVFRAELLRVSSQPCKVGPGLSRPQSTRMLHPGLDGFVHARRPKTSVLHGHAENLHALNDHLAHMLVAQHASCFFGVLVNSKDVQRASLSLSSSSRLMKSSHASLSVGPLP